MAKDRWVIRREIGTLAVEAVMQKLPHGTWALLGSVNGQYVDALQVDGLQDALLFIEEQFMLHDPLAKRSKHEHSRGQGKEESKRSTSAGR